MRDDLLRAQVDAAGLGVVVEHHRQPGALGDGAVEGDQLGQRNKVSTASKLTHRTDVRAATTAEHERPLRQLTGGRRKLRVERLLVDDRGLGPRERHARGRGHLLAVVAPRARHTHEPGRELTAAGVALVLRADRDRGQRATVRAPRTQRAHGSSDQLSFRSIGRMPTRS